MEPYIVGGRRFGTVREALEHLAQNPRAKVEVSGDILPGEGRDFLLRADLVKRGYPVDKVLRMTKEEVEEEFVRQIEGALGRV